jgi:ribosome-associated translation inhibitor RaiA
MAKESQKVTLSGFGSIDSATMPLVDKIIARHAERIGELAKGSESLHITIKQVHQREKSEKYEIHAKLLDGGKVFVSKVTERNLLTALDKALNKIIREMD